jgi:hypothetical protein
LGFKVSIAWLSKGLLYITQGPNLAGDVGYAMWCEVKELAFLEH